MKRRLLLTIVLSLAVGVAACGDDETPADNNGNNGNIDAGPDATDGGSDADDGGGEDAGDGGTEDGGDGGTDGGDTDDGTSTALNAVTAEDQALEGAASNEVTIASVTLEEDGFVVIHEDDAGSPGAIIGHKRVVAGEDTADVMVTLDRNAANGETLYAMLHGDTNANETFDYTAPGDEDGPLLDDNDDAITDSFVVNVPSVTASDLTLAAANDDLSTVVTVDSAYSNGAGWLVIHANECANFGDVLGQTELTDGANSDIAVTLTERPAEDGESLCAMLHTDNGTAGEYEFGDGSGNDGPVALADSSVVMDSFEITFDGDIPAIRITISNVGSQHYSFDDVEPLAHAAGLGLDGIDTQSFEDPAVEFMADWRYEIVNTVAAGHPFEFVVDETGVGGQGDLVVLSQDSDPDEESDAATDWVEDGNAVRFNVAGEAFEGASTGVTTSHDGVEKYQCQVHPGAMNGAVTTQ
jgi:hypothetical protein